MATFEINCCVRGYHVYQRLWTSTVGEHLSCRREHTNENDRYAVAVMKDDTVIGHVPRKFSRVCSLFLRRGGNIICVVTGTWRYSVDLPQGGLEIPVSWYSLPILVKLTSYSTSEWLLSGNCDESKCIIVHKFIVFFLLNEKEKR